MRTTGKGKKKRAWIWITSILLLCVLAAGVFLVPAVLRTVYPIKYSEQVEKYSAEYGLDKYLVYSVIKCESSFEADAHSRADARGLMQLTPRTAQWFAQDKMKIEYADKLLYEPEYNIRVGCAYLKYLLNRFEGNTQNVLAAYNAGEGKVRSWLADTRYSEDGENLSNIPYSETENYVKRVNDAYDIYIELYSEN